MISGSTNNSDRELVGVEIACGLAADQIQEQSLKSPVPATRLPSPSRAFLFDLPSKIGLMIRWLARRDCERPEGIAGASK
jgi:hypothetical protein